MKILIIALLTLTSTTLFAQNTATWIGGTPGQETKWNEPRNWDNNQVPDEDTYVIIKQLNSGHNAQPVVNFDIEVAAIAIHAGAHLTIEEIGTVIIDGEYTYSEGISIYGGEMYNKGSIHFFNLAIDISPEVLNKIKNEGYVFIDNHRLETKCEFAKLVKNQ